MTSTLRPYGRAALLLVLAACSREPAQELVTEEAEAVEEAPVAADPDDWAGAPMPNVDPSQHTCDDDSACRVWRPSTWNARVECCYEYGCALDWTPIHASDWERLRAWRQANPFDCQEAMQEEGPCAVAPAGCSLQLDATAACVDDRCAVVLPPTGPTFTESARTCRVDSDCVAARRDLLGENARCCGESCGPWTALSAEALRDARSWLDDNAPPCAEDTRCPETATRCGQDAPDVRCLAGLCRLEH